MQEKRSNHRHLSGVTLIELIIVILLIAILSGTLSIVLSGPIAQLVQVKKQARLVNIAELTLQQMAREIRLAAPNSIRLKKATAIEFLHTISGGRYRLGGDESNNDFCALPDNDRLSLDAATDCFEVLGPFINVAKIDATGGTNSQLDCINGIVDCLLIYNTGQAGNNAYNKDNIASVVDVKPHSITFNNSDVKDFSFIAGGSPSQRFQVVDTPVSFVCDPIKGTIRRYAHYKISATQPTSAEDFNTLSATEDNLLANMISSCSFEYEQQSNRASSLITLNITVRDDALGQTIPLLQQIHINNQP